MKTLIKHGTIVTAADEYRADLLIDGATIALIGTDLERSLADRVIDADLEQLAEVGFLYRQASLCPRARRSERQLMPLCGQGPAGFPGIGDRAAYDGVV